MIAPFLVTMSLLGDKRVIVFHESPDGSRRCVELGHFVFLNDGPESASIRKKWHSFKLGKKYIIKAIILNINNKFIYLL